jgi:predicted transcriptional regulator
MTGFWSIFLKMDPSDTPKEMADSGRARFLGIINARWKTLVKYGIVVHLGNRVYDITRQGKQYLAGELIARDPEGE